MRLRSASGVVARCLIALLSTTVSHSAAAPSGELALVRSLGAHLGLYDISSDGALLVLEEARRQERFVCQSQPCDPFYHRLVAKSSQDLRVLDSLTLGFEGFRKVTIAFFPGSHDILVRGWLKGKRTPARFLRWSPETQTVTGVQDPVGAPDFEFAAMLEGTTTALGRIGSGVAIWDWSTGEVRLLTDAADQRLLAGGFDRAAVDMARDLLQIRGESVLGGALSKDRHLLAVVSSEDQVGRGRLYYLRVHDLSTNRRVLRTTILDSEAGPQLVLEHVGWQVTISPLQNMVAVSYELHTPGGYKRVRRAVRFGVYSLRGGTLLGVAPHAVRTTSIGSSYVSPIAGGRLLFSPYEKFLFSTVDDSRQWRIR